MSVLAYHSGLGIARAGYLGVNIFFVISGFLITDIVARGIETGTFSFQTFYERRIRRLAPAALIMLAATAMAAMLLMTSRQYGLFLPNLAGSLFFTANYTLFERLISGFKAHADVPVIRLDAVICGRDGNCRLDVNGRPLFRDSGHFTPYGSLWVGTRINLGNRAWWEAR